MFHVITNTCHSNEVKESDFSMTVVRLPYTMSVSYAVCFQCLFAFPSANTLTFIQEPRLAPREQRLAAPDRFQPLDNDLAAIALHLSRGRKPEISSAFIIRVTASSIVIAMRRPRARANGSSKRRVPPLLAALLLLLEGLRATQLALRRRCANHGGLLVRRAAGRERACARHAVCALAHAEIDESRLCTRMCSSRAAGRDVHFLRPGGCGTGGVGFAHALRRVHRTKAHRERDGWDIDNVIPDVDSRTTGELQRPVAWRLERLDHVPRLALHDGHLPREHLVLEVGVLLERSSER